jgi:hypothetical protein
MSMNLLYLNVSPTEKPDEAIKNEKSRGKDNIRHKAQNKDKKYNTSKLQR